MKLTSLFSAVAVAAAMGTQVFADTVASETFDAYAIPEGEDFVAVKDVEGFSSKWIVNKDLDESKIIATHFDGSGQALDLSTGGSDLTFPAETTSGMQATVSMKVNMVSSDTMVDMSGDSASHTALFLYQEGEDENAVYTLKAFSYDPDLEKNVWVDLAAEGFSITNGEDVDVSIAIDYNQSVATYTVKGTTFPAINLANPTTWDTTRKLSAVAFKGTGVVDDLFVSEEAVGEYATFIFEIDDVEQATASYRVDVADFGFSAIMDPELGYISSAELWLREEGVDTTKLADLTVSELGAIAFDGTVYDFADGATYVVKGIKTAKPATIMIVNGDSDNELIDSIETTWFSSFTWAAPEGASWEFYEFAGDQYFEEVVAIDSVEDDEITIILYGYSAGGAEPTVWTADMVFGSISWTAFDPVAGTATFEFVEAEGFNFVEGDTMGTFQVVVSTELGGETSLAGTVAIDGAAGSVSGLPTDGDALFLLGIADAPAAE